MLKLVSEEKQTQKRKSRVKTNLRTSSKTDRIRKRRTRMRKIATKNQLKYILNQQKIEKTRKRRITKTTRKIK